MTQTLGFSASAFTKLRQAACRFLCVLPMLLGVAGCGVFTSDDSATNTAAQEILFYHYDQGVDNVVSIFGYRDDVAPRSTTALKAELISIQGMATILGKRSSILLTTADLINTLLHDGATKQICLLTNAAFTTPVCSPKNEIANHVQTMFTPEGRHFLTTNESVSQRNIGLLRWPSPLHLVGVIGANGKRLVLGEALQLVDFELPDMACDSNFARTDEKAIDSVLNSQNTNTVAQYPDLSIGVQSDALFKMYNPRTPVAPGAITPTPVPVPIEHIPPQNRSTWAINEAKSERKVFWGYVIHWYQIVPFYTPDTPLLDIANNAISSPIRGSINELNFPNVAQNTTAPLTILQPKDFGAPMYYRVAGKGPDSIHRLLGVAAGYSCEQLIDMVPSGNIFNPDAETICKNRTDTHVFGQETNSFCSFAAQNYYGDVGYDGFAEGGSENRRERLKYRDSLACDYRFAPLHRDTWWASGLPNNGPWICDKINELEPNSDDITLYPCAPGTTRWQCPPALNPAAAQ